MEAEKVTPKGWRTRPVSPGNPGPGFPDPERRFRTEIPILGVAGNGNSAEVVGQVGNLRRVGNPPEPLVNGPAGCGCRGALWIAHALAAQRGARRTTPRDRIIASGGTN